MNIDQDRLSLILNKLRDDLGDGFIASEVWNASDGLPLVNSQEYKSNPKVAPLFNDVTRKLSIALSESDYPGLGNYYLINLCDNFFAVVLTVDSYRQFILIDTAKTPVGLLMSVALPNLHNMLTEEMKDEKTKPLEIPVKKAGLNKDNSSRQRDNLKEVLNAFTSGINYTDYAK